MSDVEDAAAEAFNVAGFALLRVPGAAAVLRPFRVPTRAVELRSGLRGHFIPVG